MIRIDWINLIQKKQKCVIEFPKIFIYNKRISKIFPQKEREELISSTVKQASTEHFRRFVNAFYHTTDSHTHAHTKLKKGGWDGNTSRHEFEMTKNQPHRIMIAMYSRE
eukprot:TRINITY_DN45855_c0_g1_i1.p1 TRINITY_DN45855_c0_g1~~TRINITY_DN45855_c0_g1_i1.p1  ORF type:complete len:109 (-),score=4.69 TRINITY_DN45855_c0_g1_i1:346-672(-)